MRLNQILMSLQSMKGDIHRESSRFPFLFIDSSTCSKLQRYLSTEHLRAWGAGTHSAAAATSGVPAQLAQLGPRKKGGRWDSPPGTRPVCRVGRGGAGQPR